MVNSFELIKQYKKNGYSLEDLEYEVTLWDLSDKDRSDSLKYLYELYNDVDNNSPLTLAEKDNYIELLDYFAKCTTRWIPKKISSSEEFKMLCIWDIEYQDKNFYNKGEGFESTEACIRDIIKNFNHLLS